MASMDPSQDLPSAPTAEQKVEEIKSALQDLHGDELADLAQKRGLVIRKDEEYSSVFRKTVLNYLRYLRTTWTRALWSTMFLPTSEYFLHSPCYGRFC